MLNFYLGLLDTIEEKSIMEEIPCHKTKVYMVLVIESVAKNMYNKRKKKKTISYNELEYAIKDDKNFEDDISSELTQDKVIL